jgi:predicted nucleic acid-binding protein
MTAVPTVIADTGALYALVDRDDSWHERVLAWWSEHGNAVVTPVVVLPEVTWLLQARIGPAAELAFVGAVAAGEFVLEDLQHADVERAAAIMRQYGDFPLGFTDAAIAAVAERLETVDLLTTNRRHFSTLRPRGARSYTLLP